ncbi:MAG: hypothetical protein ABSB59_15550 [Streptosporangiaceae bacterium]
MKRFLAVTAVTASVAGMIFAAVPATAAAAKPQVKAYTDSWNSNLTGTGTEKGWYLRASYRSRVIRSPRLAFYVAVAHAARQTDGEILKSSQQQYFTGGHDYTKDSGQPGWIRTTPTASQIRGYEKSTDIHIVIAKLFALPALHRTGARHYHATDTVAQISGLLSYSFGLPEDFFYFNQFTSFAVSFSTDAEGRPVSLAITGTSSDMRLSIGDVFTYNRPLTIKAP